MATVQGNALKEIGRFTGSEDVEHWIKHFEMAVRVDKLSDEADALTLKLDGPAYDTWAGLTALERTSTVS